MIVPEDKLNHSRSTSSPIDGFKEWIHFLIRVASYSEKKDQKESKIPDFSVVYICCSCLSSLVLDNKRF